MNSKKRFPKGSPPRMRGRPDQWSDEETTSRLTPANAGTTPIWMLRVERVWAHPRECGDDPGLGHDPGARRGSPPRMRGRRPRLHTKNRKQRLTPANAGTTWPGQSITLCTLGSPPRMRGRPRLVVLRLDNGRLTPANAGTTRIGVLTSRPFGAHPRECGDDRLRSVLGMRRAGSPPRMRGRHRLSEPGHHRGGLTPANAGTTSCAAFSWCLGQAHPRECGDDSNLLGRVYAGPGSPPRMRGRHGRAPCGRGGRGLTPANAGTTRDGARRSGGAQAHPRECGDDLARQRAGPWYRGSPPRMRGRLGEHQYSPRARRLTPANAGTTPDRVRDACFQEGSPPRMRGRQPRQQTVPTVERLTPANAGTTSAHLFDGAYTGAHPRECGDDAIVDRTAGRVVGSPPRMRGRRQWLAVVHVTLGLTPANAGTTTRKPALLSKA